MRVEEFSRLVEPCDVVRERRAIICETRGAVCEASRIDCLMAVLVAIMLTKERGPILLMQGKFQQNFYVSQK